MDISIFRQVLPALSKFLHDSAKQSYNKSLENIYKFTQTYKLQKELLSTLGKVTKDLSLREQETWNVLSITQPYLSEHQHPTLQVNFTMKSTITYITFMCT